MHDVHRDSLIQKRVRKGGASGGRHLEEEHSHRHTRDDHDHGEHTHEPAEHAHGYDDHGNHHDHGETPHGHTHEHEEGAYMEHPRDVHAHSHARVYEDRAFAHAHDHAHAFYHSHHHDHHDAHAGVVHKIFKDPVRDWFGAGLMVLLIAAGYLQWLPGALSDGMLVCAAVIGIFPIVKNALFECVSKRSVSFELFVGLLLVAGLVMGRFVEVALVTLFILIGSFMRLNFSWRSQ